MLSLIIHTWTSTEERGGPPICERSAKSLLRCRAECLLVVRDRMGHRMCEAKIRPRVIVS